MRGKTGYLFQRPGSRNWHIKLQSPTERIEKSLRTSDRVQAEILALPMIAEHKAKLLEARPRIETTWRHEYEPGREHVRPDGERVIAADRELAHRRLIETTTDQNLFRSGELRHVVRTIGS